MILVYRHENLVSALNKKCSSNSVQNRLHFPHAYSIYNVFLSWGEILLLNMTQTFLKSFREIQPFPLRPLFVLLGSFSVPCSVSLCSLKCDVSVLMEISPVSFSHNRANAWYFQRGCGCVLCQSKGLTALALILGRPSLPQRAELFIKKPSAQTKSFHLESWHTWQSLCLFIAVLLAARSQFCLKATWIPLKCTRDECYRCGLDLPQSDLNIETISTDRMSLKQGFWIYLGPPVWFVCHPFKTDLGNTPLAKKTCSKFRWVPWMCFFGLKGM